MRTRLAVGAAWLAGACALSVAACGSEASAPAVGADGGEAGVTGSITVRVLAINDFHGALDQGPADAAGRRPGGAAYLASLIKQARTPTTVFVSAGDLIGGSPLGSGLFHDEPTIEVMNAMGLDFAGVGNHEFDEGLTELLRMQGGGCHPTDGCKGGATFEGAKFRFLAANVLDTAQKTIFPPYEIRDLGGAKIAFVGMTLEATPAVTLASGVEGLEFKDEVDTMNALLPELQAKGAAAVVLMLHQGGRQAGPPNGCDNLQGSIVDIAKRMPSAVKVILSAHSHAAYNCMIEDKIVTSAGSQGNLVTQVDVVVDLPSQTVTSASATNLFVNDELPPDDAVRAIVERYTTLVAPRRDEIIGTITADITTAGGLFGESAAGDLIADAMREGTAGPPNNAQIAFMNPGGIRGSFLFPKSGAETTDGQITYGEAFKAQPFSNTLITVSVSGEDLDEALENALGRGAPLQVSGLTYVYDRTKPVGSRIDLFDIHVAGVPVSATTLYRVTTNAIVADATTGSAAIANGADPVGAGIDLDLLVDYFRAHSPVTPNTTARIRGK